MRLVLRPPEGWRLVERGDRRRLEAPGLLVVELSELREKPASLRTWIVEALRACGLIGGTVAIGEPVERATDDGWPMILVAARLEDGSGAGAGHLLGAFYVFGAHAASAVAGALDAARLADARPVLHTGRPDFSSLFLGPCDFFGPTPPRAP